MAGFFFDRNTSPPTPLRKRGVMEWEKQGGILDVN